MGELQFIFVHGLSGWGSYDSQYSRMPYWGMRGGDLMPFLREKGESTGQIRLRQRQTPVD